jgi:hypothetical protein
MSSTSSSRKAGLLASAMKLSHAAGPSAELPQNHHVQVEVHHEPDAAQPHRDEGPQADAAPAAQVEPLQRVAPGGSVLNGHHVDPF